MRISPIRTALVLGAVLGLWHTAWAALVAAGLAQSLMDFVLRIHFLRVPVTVAPFNIETAALLVSVTFVIGFIIGEVLALIWNAIMPRGGVA